MISQLMELSLQESIMDHITVSICIPAYRDPDAFRRCLSSVYAQTYTDYEVIVTDDTPDNSVETAFAIFSKRSNVHYYHNCPSRGTPGNWNYAIELATGEYIILMHHDDWFFSPDCLGILVRALKDKDLDFAFARSVGIDKEGRRISDNNPTDECIKKVKRDVESLFFGNIIGAPSAVIFRRRGILFDLRLKWLVDLDFYIRYLKGSSFDYIPSAVVAIGISEAQTTNSCIGNFNVEMSEAIIVYNKLQHGMRKAQSFYGYFSDLFYRFKPSLNQLGEQKSSASIYIFFGIYQLNRVIRKALDKIMRIRSGGKFQ